MKILRFIKLHWRLFWLRRKENRTKSELLILEAARRGFPVREFGLTPRDPADLKGMPIYDDDGIVTNVERL